VFPLLLLPLLTLPAAVQAQFNYVIDDDTGTIIITGYYDPGGAVIIPDTIDGLPVTGIGTFAFRGHTSLTSVTIPDSVTSIGRGAFLTCYALTNVTIPDSVTSIGRGAFSDCISLTSVTIGNGVTNIGDYAFYNTSLTSVTIPNGVTSIGNYAFYDCISLTGVTIGNGVTNIGWYAFGDDFADYDSLTEVYFQGNAPSVTYFGARNATVYYLPGTTGWGPTFGGRPTALWSLPNPLILASGTGFGVQTNGFGFIISWAANNDVVVEASTDLANPSWSPLQTNTLTGGSAYFNDPQWTNYPGRFYRLRAL